MHQTSSKDGTAIAFDRTGQGPPLVLVLGAFNDRSTGAALASALANTFTVYSYDRRGRGDSGRSSDYELTREVEDLEAVLAAAGGSAALFGYSSGAALALLAAGRGARVSKVVLYDLPPAQPKTHVAALAALIEGGQRGAAVEYFQQRLVGLPEHVVLELRHAPFRPALEAMAHTLIYDAKLVSEGLLSSELLASVREPVLAVAGGAGPAVMREVSETVVRALPNGRSLLIPDATHHLDPAKLAPVLAEFCL